METVREVKRRIKTSKNISQMTGAMEMVSAVKMRRAQMSAIVGRDYTSLLEKMVRVLVSQTEGQENSLFLNQPKNIEKILLIVIAPQKGLCGPLIGNLQRSLSGFVNEFPKANLSFVTIGKKSVDVVRIYSQKVEADFTIPEKELGVQAVASVADYAVQQIANHNYDAVYVAYTQFISTVSQKPVIKQFLPIPALEKDESEKQVDSVVLFEPNEHEFLEKLILRYSQGLLYQFYLEGAASEHSARMIAMKNAHDNADDIVSDLTLYYNKMRQNSITTELIDSVSSRLTQE